MNLVSGTMPYSNRGLYSLLLCSQPYSAASVPRVTIGSPICSSVFIPNKFHSLYITSLDVLVCSPSALLIYDLMTAVYKCFVKQL